MSNGKKELKPIKQEHNGPVVNYNDKLAKLSKYLPDKEEKEEYHDSGDTLISAKTGKGIGDADEGQFSEIKRGPIPMAPHVVAQDDSDKYRKGEKFYIK